MPASIICRTTAGESDAGPSVATILVRRSMTPDDTARQRVSLILKVDDAGPTPLHNGTVHLRRTLRVDSALALVLAGLTWGTMRLEEDGGCPTGALAVALVLGQTGITSMAALAGLGLAVLMTPAPAPAPA